MDDETIRIAAWLYIYIAGLLAYGVVSYCAAFLLWWWWDKRK